ncbi:MAG: lipid-A-disaccharide synthase [Bacteroidales bacterium]|nr:lipid-A-disaccharide synthase [Bacteroidales bacterium]
MRWMISAGEASGDLHAAQLIKALRQLDPRSRFTFLGGDEMAEAAGTQPLIHYRRMAYMGFSEILRNLGGIFDNLKMAKQALRQCKPDALVLVDYPSFNLKLAKEAVKLGVPVYWYISPKVWAWKEWRVKSIKKYVRKVLSILPFEVGYFRGKGMEVEYVGNPSREEIDERIAKLPSRKAFIEALGLDGQPYLLLAPGSRKGEIRNNLPVMLKAVEAFPQYPVVVAGAPGIEPQFYKSVLDTTRDPHARRDESADNAPTFVFGKTFELMRYAEAALVTSGTATLECALMGTPQVVCYRANGSRLSYNIMKQLIHVPYVSLPNLITGREIVHEALVHLCTPEILIRELGKVLPKGEGHQAQLDGYKEMRQKLGTNPAAETAAKALLSNLSTKA